MSSAESAASSIAPPSEQVIHLTQADLGISCVFLLLCGYITWQHGKTGMVCWPIFITAFIARIIADAYLLANQDDPLIPSAVSTMTDAAVVTCVSLAIIGTVYQSYVIFFFFFFVFFANVVFELSAMNAFFRDKISGDFNNIPQVQSSYVF